MENKTFNGNACADCEIAIVAGTLNEHPEALKHLQECSACREFADFQKQLCHAQRCVLDHCKIGQKGHDLTGAHGSPVHTDRTRQNNPHKSAVQ